jgi:transcriptional regulator with XRE-family HTH domain
MFMFAPAQSGSAHPEAVGELKVGLPPLGLEEGFADKIGMRREYYSALEHGESNLTLKTLRRVCAGLGVMICEILRDADV